MKRLTLIFSGVILLAFIGLFPATALVQTARKTYSKPIQFVPEGTTDAGSDRFPRFLADVNGDGVRDYCRVVGNPPFLSCQLGKEDGGFRAERYGFNSEAGIDFGNPSMEQWMEDVNGDGRADFCRWVGTQRFAAALLAGEDAFASKADQYTRIKQVGSRWKVE